MTKLCPDCKVVKNLDMFNNHKRNKDGKQSRCRTCNSEEYYLNKERYFFTGKRYRDENKEKILSQKKKRYANDIINGINILGYLKDKYEDIPCLNCNNVYPFYIMDFDHRVDSIKLFCIGHKNTLKATPERVTEVEKEIAKCDYVCANCHREQTYQRKNS